MAARSSQDVPHRLRVAANHLAEAAALSDLIAQVRADTTACLFLCGGATSMSDESQHDLIRLLDALALLPSRGIRIVVGDGGTRAGLMEAAGLVRRRSGDIFPLIGIAPTPELQPQGETPIDPNHSHVIAIDNDAWPAGDSYWGSETAAMYWIFARLAAGRPSATLVANGGSIVLDEVHANAIAKRPMVLIAGSGRATDVLIARLTGIQPDRAADDNDAEDLDALRARIEELKLADVPRELYHIFPLQFGPERLADLLARLLQ